MVFEWARGRVLCVPGHVTSRALVPVLRTLPAAKYNIQQWTNSMMMLLKRQLQNCPKITTDLTLVTATAQVNGKGQDQIVNGLLVEKGSTSHSTQFRSLRRGCFYRSDDPTNSVRAL